MTFFWPKFVWMLCQNINTSELEQCGMALVSPLSMYQCYDIMSPLGIRGSFFITWSNENVCIPSYFLYCGIHNLTVRVYNHTVPF
jgi:hypothetical protein